jgi:hypothetical protein
MGILRFDVLAEAAKHRRAARPAAWLLRFRGWVSKMEG